MAKFWLRDIWGSEWDRHRRFLLLKHYRAYFRNRDIPGEHLPLESPDSANPDSSASMQQAFCEAFGARIEAVQASAVPAERVHLTYRPLGKNLRLVGTAIRDDVRRGRRVAIDPGGTPSEVRNLARRGYAWDPWVWIRDGMHDEAAPRDAAHAWNLLFRNPTAYAAGDACRPLPELPPVPSGIPNFEPRFLRTVLELAVSTRYIFTPVESIGERIEAMKRAADWPESEAVLGIHVRRGDAASTDANAEGPKLATRKSFPLATYLETADRICKRYGIRHIFLATESPSEIERAREMRPQYRFLWMDYDRSLFPNISKSSQFIEDLVLDHPERARPLAESAILDLAFFRECHAFIGAFNSEFSVLGWLLAVGSRGQLVPYVSLSRASERWSLNPFDALLNLRNNCPLELYHW
ncbi:MAG: hypothetical protein WEG36_06170 [Gemmatimonadota bacterium]